VSVSDDWHATCTLVARVPEGHPVTKVIATSSRLTPDAVNGVTAPTEDPVLNETVMSDPVGAEVGPSPAIDTVPGGPPDEDGAIDGLPGRYERQDEEDASAGLDMTQAPLGASNG
jgi:hypothetical protein